MEKPLKLNNANKNKYEITAAAYLRVSTTKQGEEGNSIESQLSAAKNYAEYKKWILEDSLIFEEKKPATKVSGKKFDKLNIIDNFRGRTELTELLHKAQRREFKHLIIYSRDRLSRVVEDAIALELFFERCKVKIHYVKEGEDFEDSNPKVKRLLHIIFTSLAEMEINLLSTRVKEGGKACISKGNWPGGKVPFGYVADRHLGDLQDKKKNYTKLKVSELESKLVKKIFDLYASGLGYRKIAKEMNEKYSFIKWSKSKVEAIIKNETYTGQMLWDRRGGRRNPGKHDYEPIKSYLSDENIIINKDHWNEILQERCQRAENKDPFYYDTEYILKGKLICSKCKRAMKPKYPGVNRNTVYKCANNKKERKKCNIIIPCSIAEDEFMKYLTMDLFKFQNTDRFWECYNLEFDKRVEDIVSTIDLVTDKEKETEETLNKIKNQIEVEKEQNLKEIFQLQYAVYGNLMENYKRTREMLKTKLKVKKMARGEFDNIVYMFIPALFMKPNMKEITRIRREFIVNFIDTIEIEYDKENKKANIKEIVFLPPEFI
ncbi:recombinase family protein [Clostridium sp. A1-XYC3]|uniref:Recombinase family protein n=1 Tax=Clostridium tanneri TaxID=3037988 RepID=A0ABU4JXJ1_9CLOT|nr:recombinase family protein [Clostridium sp. A1-XYC3]MDW8802643.1 recombinase family protein [Clostridium sp. A1-XYC3]